jgi:Glycosyltransferase 61
MTYLNSTWEINYFFLSFTDPPPAPNTSIMCEFSDYRYNMCSIEANIKVMGSSATVLIVPSSSTAPTNTTVWKIRPFTRKWEEGTMANVRELTIRWASDQNQGLGCDVTHDVPVLIFATAGFRFNPYHDFSDLLIPLFVASKQYNGKIQFAATNFDWPWINKYLPHLQALSHYPIINLDSESLVHCFPSGQVGLRGNGPLSVESSSAKNGYTTQEFRQFVRTSLSLKRAHVEIIEKNLNQKPKIAILLRKWTRTFTNENEIIEMAEGVGFEVIRADTETTKDFPRIAHLINSCDVLMGLHGAGLTNMMYLPNNATVVQIIPWGDLGFISWKDYGEPTKDMGLNYVEYEIKPEESTLVEKYPRNHTVFTNPKELHEQGWRAMYNVFLVEQSVKLDVNRFRVVLVGLFNSLTQ